VLKIPKPHQSKLFIREKIIAIICFSNDFVSSLIEPSLTTVEQAIKEMGRMVTQLLLDQIERDVADWKALLLF
jgi:DNA-binding LacI/PurR family transcriptional regulator